jgi:hypothetical protein
METLKKHGLFEKVPLVECWSVIGKAPVGMKWVDANMGDKEKPEHRCRLVAEEIKKDKREDLFAATPPLEANMVLFSLFASMPEMCLDFADAVQAYFHAKARRDAHVDLPKEDHQEETHSNLRGRCTARGMLFRIGSWSTLR